MFNVPHTFRWLLCTVLLESFRAQLICALHVLGSFVWKTLAFHIAMYSAICWLSNLIWQLNWNSYLFEYSHHSICQGYYLPPITCCAAVCSKAYYGSLQRNKIKQHISSPLWGESTVDWWNKKNEIAQILYQVTVDGFPSQRASNTESISMPSMHYTEV